MIPQAMTVAPRATAPLRRAAKVLRVFRVLCNWIWSRNLQHELRAVGPGFNVDCTTRIFGPHQVQIGANFFAGRGLKITTFIHPDSDSEQSVMLRIGNGVAMNEYVTITALDPIELEDGVLIGSRVYIGNSNHGIYKGSHHGPPDVPPNLRPLVGSGSIAIGRNCWIGEGAIVPRGVRVGKGAVIAAGSVVTNDIPANSVAAGNPARVVKQFLETTLTWNRLA